MEINECGRCSDVVNMKFSLLTLGSVDHWVLGLLTKRVTVDVY